MTFLWPPRPETKILPMALGYYERKGFLAQRKKNGTCEVIMVDEQGLVEFRTRHNEPNKQWTPTAPLLKYFSQFPNSVFVGELLHNKTKTVKNIIYLFDVLQFNGHSLVGERLSDRLDFLHQLPTTPEVKMVETIEHDFEKAFAELHAEEDEGLVLKDPNSRLRNCLRNGLNSDWQVKCRKATKNYSF